jgi:hypothetical protein
MGNTQTSEPLNFEKVWLMFQESDKKFQEAKERMEKSSLETDKRIEELGKQIGGLGNKFGFFTEEFYIPSIEKILFDKFNCKDVSRHSKFRDNGNSYEIDVFGESDDSCYLVEIKSNLTQRDIKQHINKLKKFSEHKKMYDNFKKYGIIAASKYDEEQIKRVLSAGFYFIFTADNMATLYQKEDFKPKEW